VANDVLNCAFTISGSRSDPAGGDQFECHGSMRRMSFARLVLRGRAQNCVALGIQRVLLSGFSTRVLQVVAGLEVAICDFCKNSRRRCKTPKFCAGLFANEPYFTAPIRKLGTQNSGGFAFCEREAGGVRRLFKLSKSVSIQGRWMVYVWTYQIGWPIATQKMGHLPAQLEPRGEHMSRGFRNFLLLLFGICGYIMLSDIGVECFM
jgi:hypothetical protein